MYKDTTVNSKLHENKTERQKEKKRKKKSSSDQKFRRVNHGFWPFLKYPFLLRYQIVTAAPAAISTIIRAIKNPHIFERRAFLRCRTSHDSLDGEISKDEIWGGEGDGSLWFRLLSLGSCEFFVSMHGHGEAAPEFGVFDKRDVTVDRVAECSVGHCGGRDGFGSCWEDSGHMWFFHCAFFPAFLLL